MGAGDQRLLRSEPERSGELIELVTNALVERRRSDLAGRRQLDGQSVAASRARGPSSASSSSITIRAAVRTLKFIPCIGFSLMWAGSIVSPSSTASGAGGL